MDETIVKGYRKDVGEGERIGYKCSDFDCRGLRGELIVKGKDLLYRCVLEPESMVASGRSFVDICYR